MGFNNGYDSGYCDAKTEFAAEKAALEKRVAELEAGGGDGEGSEGGSGDAQVVSLNPPLVFIPNTDLNLPDDPETIVNIQPNYPITLNLESYSLPRSALSIERDEGGGEEYGYDHVYIVKIAIDDLLQQYPNENQMFLLCARIENVGNIPLRFKFTLNGTALNGGTPFTPVFALPSTSMFVVCCKGANGFSAELLDHFPE